MFHLIMLRTGLDLLQLESNDVRIRKPIVKHASDEKKKRILIVGMSESPHLHSWIDGVAEIGSVSDVWLFPSDCPYRSYKNSKIIVRTFPYFMVGRSTNLIFRLLDILTKRLWRSYFLYREIKRLKPTHLHFHETQHGAYLYNPIAQHPRNKFAGKLILSTWGSDLIVYGKIESHIVRIRQTMSWVEVLTSERVEDLVTAKANGFQGKFLAPVYITVGNKNLDLTLKKTSERLLVLIKGYQDNHGRGLNALESIELLSTQFDLQKFSFRIFSSSESVKLRAELLKHKIDIETLPHMPKSKLMEYFKEARVYLGLAISDGLSTSMVEAMTYGAFPIQSLNSSAPTFLVNGVTGGVVDPWRTQEIADLLEIALSNDELVDSAAVSNRQTITTKYSWELGLSKLVEVYE